MLNFKVLSSKQIASVIIKFILSLYGIFLEQSALLHWQTHRHRHLEEVGEQLIFLRLYSTIVPHHNARLFVAVDLVLLYLGEARACTQDTTSLVLMDLIVANVDAAVEHDDAVIVVVNVIVFYPTEPPFDAEDALRSRLVN